jgi:hypothetical protein
MTITTKYLGPTDFRGSRIRATSSAGRSVTLPYDCALDSFANHAAAARALAAKVGVTGQFASGSVSDGYVFVRVYSDLVTF